LIRCTPPTQIGLTSKPIIIDAQIGTNPAPGVIATKPTTKPVEQPTSVGFLAVIISIINHEIKPQADEIPVVINAWTAVPLAAKALPALNPNQPNHSNAAPKRTNGMLCG